MDESVSDNELLREFTQGRSESAFQKLVERHADLVYGTALRQVGQASVAEEVMQDVFIALAHKAATIRGESTLAGWLYKTTVFKARHWWRGESRRKQREQAAVELNTTMKDDASIFSSLAGVLDEGLLELRELERQALLLRFFEQRNHREVGAALGIGEDAARKRVDKALAQLTRFFQKRGYAAGSVAVTAAALNAAALNAPAGLAAQVAKVALAKASLGVLPWLAGWLAGFLRPSRACTAGLCVAVLLGPGLWQGARLLSAKEEHRRLEGLLAAVQGQRELLGQDLRQVRRQLRGAANTLAQLQVSSAYTALLTEANLDPRLFRWEESASYVRVPKALMHWLTFDTGKLDEGRTLNSHGARVFPTLLGALGLNAEEQTRVQRFCQTQMDAYWAAAESRSCLTNLPPLNAVTKSVPFTPDTRAWFIPALSAGESLLWRQPFQEGLVQLVGAERAGIILANAKHDGSLSECFQGFGSEDDLVAITPSAEGGCWVGKLHHAADGRPLGMKSSTQTTPISQVLNLCRPEPPDPARPEFPTWDVLGRRPLPAALADYLRQWTAAHPEVPDQAPSTP